MENVAIERSDIGLSATDDDVNNGNAWDSFFFH
jgi:hypothetical protein